MTPRHDERRVIIIYDMPLFCPCHCCLMTFRLFFDAIVLMLHCLMDAARDVMPVCCAMSAMLMPAAADY